MPVSGLVMCYGADGHVEIEIANSEFDCGSSNADDHCGDCNDVFYTFQDQESRTSGSFIFNFSSYLHHISTTQDFLKINLIWFSHHKKYSLGNHFLETLRTINLRI